MTPYKIQWVSDPTMGRDAKMEQPHMLALWPVLSSQEMEAMGRAVGARGH